MVILSDFERRAVLILYDDGIPAGEIALVLQGVRSFGRRAVVEHQDAAIIQHAADFRELRRAVFELIRHNTSS